MDDNGHEEESTKKQNPTTGFETETTSNMSSTGNINQVQNDRFKGGDCLTTSHVRADRILYCNDIEDKEPSPIKIAKPLDLYSNVSIK